ncbi:MAG: uracil-DNA glycosylase, partial [Hyphomonadaceae bacterium]|nr:uracil-DNA glycosylase [Hyphomonadaceae bacterium]
HDSTVRALGLKLKDYPFGHGTRYEVSVDGRDYLLVSSYHCSRYNTQTRRLTTEMFEAVMARAKQLAFA